MAEALPAEESSGMAGSSEDILVGICVTSETIAQQPCNNAETMLGFILANISTNAQSLRGLMHIQLDTLPQSFKFLTKQGWPVTSIQEALIKIQHLINENDVIKIQPGFDRPRVGIITKDGTALGFVFISSLTLMVRDLRRAVASQLGGRSWSCNTDIVFLDRNRWPICPSQESSLSILDILSGASVYVFGAGVSNREDGDRPNGELDATDSPPQKLLKPTPSYQHSSHQHTSSLTVGHSLAVNSLHRSRPTSPIPFENEQLAKDVVISYVRAEATQYALDLKDGLEDEGFSVYLDVHEIRCGTDWQDSLNFAVSNCEVFVPLLTPAYGQTQWTNREIKLADVLGKFIVPVNFLDTWPPGCLAIQFATTQFIAWKRPDHSNVKSKKPLTDNGAFGKMAKTSELGNLDDREKTYSWDMSDIQYVAVEVAGRFKDLRDTQTENCLTRRVTMLKSYGSILPGGVNKSSFVTMESRDGKPLVVIGVHPNQADFAKEIKTVFECEGYEVWCTTELISFADYGTPASQELQSQSSTGSTIPIVYTQDISNSNDPKVIFQQRVDEAGIVLFVLSKAFAESKTCKQQVFYCEHRKRVVPLNYEHFEMPGWLSMLIGTSTFEDVQRTGYKDSLLSRVKKAFDPLSEEYNAEANKEAEFDNQVAMVRCSIPLKHCVYISGGTVFYFEKSEQICKAIGKSLAKQDSIVLATGGFYGVGKVVSRSFFDTRQQQKKPSNTWHILPVRDDQDRSKQGSQNEDKTFRSVNFGETLFYGESVRERENIVSRAFDICILIEGGPGAAHEAEQFSWSEHVVIPIKCTGGAAGGKFNVPEKIFKVPPGVNANDWELLGDKNAGIDEIGDAVARIVVAIQERKDSTDTSVLQASRKASFCKMKTVIIDDDET